MNDLYKWILLSSQHSRTRVELDALSSEYKNVSDYDPLFQTPSMTALLHSLENPPEDDVTIICYPDSLYPEKLRILKNPPPVLYVRGDPKVLDDKCSVAVVGSRNASSYGLGVTADFCRDFCESDITIISGGAKGIDSAAAETALKFGGKTVAVFGCGIDVAYPSDNKGLFERIVKSGGAIVSEYPFGTKPMPAYFPQRNRIIAALSDGCVVTEAGLRSGSLITANMVMDLRKPLFSVPGNITSRGSEGTNHLIKTGAYMAVNGMQVVAEIKMIESFAMQKNAKRGRFVQLPLGSKGKDKEKEAEKREGAKGAKPKTAAEKPKKTVKTSPEEEKIISAIQNGSVTLDEIGSASGLGGNALQPLLTMMELKGLIKKEYGEKYSLC